MSKNQNTVGSMPSKNKTKQTLITGFKVLLIGALLYYLASKGFISVQATQKALTQWEKILPAFLAVLINACLGVVRWQWLLKAQDIHLTFARTFQLTMIGNFFNIALPGAVSGDFVKAFYVGKEIKGQRGRAFGSILFDRVAGVSALVLLSGGALAFSLRTFLNTPLLNAIQFLVEIAALSVILFYGYLFLVKEKHDPLLALLRKLEKAVTQAGSFTRIYEGIRHYHNHRLAVIQVLAISVLIHLTTGWICLTFAQALGDSHLSLLALYIVVPLGLLVTAVPIAPAGVGTGNIAFLYFFHLLGSERGADVYSLVALFNILVGCIGGLIYLKFKNQDVLPPNLEELRA